MLYKKSNWLIDRWRDGVPLSAAWFEFGDPYAVRKLRLMKAEGPLESQRLLMVADLWAGLCIGEFLALGKCVNPTVSDGPVLIPRHTFEFRPPNEIGKSDDIEISGWRYENVTVVRNHGDNDNVLALYNENQSRKRGPKPIAPLIAAAIEKLIIDDPLFSDRSQAKQIEKIRYEVAKQNPARFPGRSQPGYTTVWNYVTGRKPLN